MPSKAEQTEATRRALIDAARELFAADGFAGTSTEAVVRRAGVTRGALYHHFKDKQDLFAAVYEDVERRLVESLATRITPGGDPVGMLVEGVDVFLEACLDPAVRRISLLEGPAVLGWRRWHEVQELYALGLTKAVLQTAMDAGLLRPLPVDALAHLLLGAVVESGMVLAVADDPARAKAELAETLHGVVEALRRG
jgi:AcrR family transcriptional regulator